MRGIYNLNCMKLLKYILKDKISIVYFSCVLLLTPSFYLSWDYFVVKPIRDMRLRHTQQWEQLKVIQKTHSDKLDEKYTHFLKPLGRNYRYKK